MARIQWWKKVTESMSNEPPTLQHLLQTQQCAAGVETRETRATGGFAYSSNTAHGAVNIH